MQSSHRLNVYDYTGAEQPFNVPPAVLQFILLNGVETSFNSSETNSVNLFFRFIDDNRQPVELEEFYVRFFDFDQEWADGAKAYVRETLLVGDWTTVYFTNTSQLERRFSREENFRVPIRTVDTWDDVNDQPETYRTLLKDGVYVRSTQQGTGARRAIKYEYGACAVRTVRLNVLKNALVSKQRAFAYVLLTPLPPWRLCFAPRLSTGCVLSVPALQHLPAA